MSFLGASEDEVGKRLVSGAHAGPPSLFLPASLLSNVPPGPGSTSVHYQSLEPWIRVPASGEDGGVRHRGGRDTGKGPGPPAFIALLAPSPPLSVCFFPWGRCNK